MRGQSKSIQLVSPVVIESVVVHSDRVEYTLRASETYGEEIEKAHRHSPYWFEIVPYEKDHLQKTEPEKSILTILAEHSELHAYGESQWKKGLLEGIKAASRDGMESLYGVRIKDMKGSDVVQAMTEAGNVVRIVNGRAIARDQKTMLQVLKTSGKCEVSHGAYNTVFVLDETVDQERLATLLSRIVHHYPDVAVHQLMGNPSIPSLSISPRFSSHSLRISHAIVRAIAASRTTASPEKSPLGKDALPEGWQVIGQGLSAFAEALRNEELDFCTIASQPGSLFEKPGFGLPLRLDEADREDLANQIKDTGSDYDEILIVRGSSDSRTDTHLFVVASPEQTLALATRIMDVMVKQQQAREASSHEELFAD